MVFSLSFRVEVLLGSPLHYIHKNSEIEHDNSSDKMTIGLKFPKYEHKHALGLKYIVPA